MKSSGKAIIPPTTPETYLTGVVALNIPSPEGSNGDWHALALFERESAVLERYRGGGAGMFHDTNAWLGNTGIHECGQWFIRRGHGVSGPVWSANHYRALLDMVIDCWAKGRVPAPVAFFDYVAMPRHQAQFLSLLHGVQGKFPDGLRRAFAKWLLAERRSEREKWMCDAA